MTFPDPGKWRLDVNIGENLYDQIFIHVEQF